MALAHTSGLLAFQSDRIEDLVDQLVRELVTHELRQATSPADLPFIQHKVVIPTSNLETYLNFEIAARRGIAANVEFLTMEQFLCSLLPTDNGGEPPVRLLDRLALTRQLLTVLNDPQLMERSSMHAVRQFINPDHASPSDRERRLFQLAHRVARLFEEYGFSRQNLLRHWNEATPGLKREYPNANPTASQLEIEAWQMQLWHELFGDQGIAYQSTDGDDRPWMTLPQAIVHFARTDEPGLQWPTSVHLFGHSYLPRFFRDLFSRRTTAEDGRIALYVMTPSLEYWSHGIAGDRDEDPVFDILTEDSLLEGDEYPLALAIWGRAGRDYQRLIDTIAYDREDISRHRDRPAHTLLQHFQHHIRDMSTARRLFVDNPLPADEKSLNFWSCTGIQRECESIASEIWELVTTHDDLRFNDIAVVVQPDERASYQTHLQAAFARTEGIPCNVIDVEATESSPFLEAIRLLLELPLGSFRRRELLALLIHPNLVSNYPDADEQAWLHWCETLNIFQGADATELEQTYLSEDRFTWGQGMRRLILGAFMTPPHPDQPHPLSIDDQQYLPHETSHQQLDTVAQLTAVASELIDTARRERDQTRPLHQWMEHFADLVARHLQPRDRNERRTEMAFYEGLDDIAAIDAHPDRDIGYRTAFDFAMRALSKMEDRHGQYLADGVVISAFRPMRPIPFKVVFITGLGEGKFPAPDPPDMLDLRRVKSEMHDVNPRYQDQYMFLETLISTRARLYLSWIGRHAITGEPIEPASVVHQLREMILEMVPNRGPDTESIRQQLQRRIQIRQQPLRRYDDRYFPALVEGEKAPTIDARGPDAIAPRAAKHRDESPANPEKIWPNHHREARREAQVRALRRQLDERLPEGYLPTMQQLRQLLDKPRFKALSEAVQWSTPTSKTRGVDDDRPVLRVRDLRKFLECPLQASARVILRLFDEDDDDALHADHEPFEAEFLTHLMLVRRSFFAALADGDLSDENLRQQLHDQTDTAALRGELPAGLFLEAEHQRCLSDLTAYADALGGADFNGRLHRIRFGTDQRRQPVDEYRDPITIAAEIDGQTRPVEIHGTVAFIDDGDERFLLQLALTRARSKYFVRAGLEQIVLRAAGFDINAPIRVATTNKYAKSKTISDQTTDDAQRYLAHLCGQLLERTHDYFLPIELVEDLLDEASIGDDDAALRLHAQRLKDNDYKTIATEYGPVSRWHHIDPPPMDKARDYVRTRYAPFGECF